MTRSRRLARHGMAHPDRGHRAAGSAPLSVFTSLSGALLGCLLLAAAPGQDGEDIPRLAEGVVGGVLDDQDPTVETPGLEGRSLRAKMFLLQVPEPGPWRIELRAATFDAYLVLRNARGEVLAEDDNGWMRTQARITARELSPDEEYIVEAGALKSRVGPFELQLLRGEAPELSEAERNAAFLEDCEHDLQVVRDEYGPDADEMISAHFELAQELADSALPDAAQEYFDRTVSLFETLHEENSEYLGGVLMIQARHLRTLARYDQAVPLLRRAVSIYEALAGEGVHRDPSVARSLNLLAMVLKQAGEFDEAREPYGRALMIWEELGNQERQADLHNNLASLLEQLGEYGDAGEHYRLALELYTTVFRGKDSLPMARCLNKRASMLRLQGVADEARRDGERAIKMLRALGRSKTADMANCLRVRAAVLGDQGQQVEALLDLREACSILEILRGEDHWETALARVGLARVLAAIDEDEEAERLYAQALEVLRSKRGERHPYTLQAVTAYAALLTDQGKYAAAQPLLQESLTTSREVLGERHPQTATQCNNLAFLLQQCGSYDEAMPLYEKAQEIWATAFGKDHPVTSRALLNRAFLQVDMGQDRQALELIHAAQADSHERAWRALQTLEEAARYSYLGGLRYQLELELSIVAGLEDPAEEITAYEDLLAWKGRIARSLFASKELLARDQTEEQKRLISDLHDVQAALSRLVYRRRITDRAQHEREMNDLIVRRTELELELHRSRAAEIEEERVTLEELLDALPEGSAVLDFFVHRNFRPAQLDGAEVVQIGDWTEEQLSAWVVRKDRAQPVRIDLGAAASMERKVQAFLEELKVQRGVAPGEDAPRERERTLETKLWEPLAPHLEGVTTLFVSPDSFLGTLAFETLQLEDKTFLVEKYAFVYQQDLAALTRMAGAREIDRPTVLSVGHVNFSKGAVDEREGIVAVTASADRKRGGERYFRKRWAELQATDGESRVVIDLYDDFVGEEQGRLLLQAEQPTEDRLKREMPRFSHLHLATHGYFFPQGFPGMWKKVKEEGGPGPQLREEEGRLVERHPGLLTGLVCAGVTGRAPELRNDGYLTAEEVSWLDLGGVDLVVLSACETGLGRAESGEGLIGLRHAFRMAGARTAISSLWSVRDESTGQLMEDFYTYLWEDGLGKHEALRQAQLDMLERNRMEKDRPIPSTWGPFVLSGNWR